MFGESKSANLDAVNEFLHQMGNIVKKYDVENNYNAEEKSLFYK